MRPSGREANQLRKIKLTRNYTKHAEGSVLAEFGDTKVICTASIEERVPRFLKDKKSGWLTAEYGMLPRSTNSRMAREAYRGKQGERTITIDCDVIQADGGTRTTAITGAYIALVDAVDFLIKQQKIKTNPIKGAIAAVSVGIYKAVSILDLDYLKRNCKQY